MSGIIAIKQAEEKDLSVIEEILLEAVNNFGMWSEEQVSRERLAKDFSPDELYIAYINDIPAGCMALQDCAPFFWFEKTEKGESLFLRRLAVKRSAAGQNFSKHLLEYAVNKFREKNIKSLRLDCDANIEKLNNIYKSFGFILEKRETMKIGGKDYHISFYVYNIK